MKRENVLARAIIELAGYKYERTEGDCVSG